MDLISGKLFFFILTFTSHLTSIDGSFNLSIQTIYKRFTKRSASLFGKRLNFVKYERKLVKVEAMYEPEDFTNKTLTLEKHLMKNQKSDFSKRGNLSTLGCGTNCCKDPKTLIPDINDECMKHNICLKVSNYPVDCANALIKERCIEVDEKEIKVTSLEVESNKEVKLCKDFPRDVVPMAARAIYSVNDTSATGKWFFVLNNIAKPVYKYKARVCKGVYGEKQGNITTCDNITIPQCKCSCHQGYYQGTLLAISRNGTLITIWANFLGCCECRCKNKSCD